MDVFTNILFNIVCPIGGCIGIIFILFEIVYSFIMKRNKELIEYMVQTEVTRQLNEMMKHKDSE